MPFFGRYYREREYDGRLGPSIKEEDKDGRTTLVAQARITPSTKNMICGIDNPVLMALDTVELKRRCYNCYALHKTLLTLPTKQSHEDKVESVILCDGCETVSFCSEQCRKTADRDCHGYECSIFRDLHPKVPPSNLRAVLRLLLLRQRPYVFPDRYWQNLVTCDGNVDNLRKAGGKRWEELINLTQCAIEFTKTGESFETILNIFCLLLTQGVPLQTREFTNIGNAFHPQLAKLSHSCDPNSILMSNPDSYGDYNMRVVPLRKIAKEEKITIAYIDCSAPVDMRKKALQKDNFIDCNCSKCESEVSSSELDQMTDDEEVTLKQALETVRAAEADTTKHLHLQRLRYALHLLISKSWEWEQYPFPMIVKKLVDAYLHDHQFNLAFVFAATLRFARHEPSSQPSPVSWTEDVTFIQIMDKVISGEEWSSQQLNLAGRGLNLVGVRNYIAGRILSLGNMRPTWALPYDIRQYLQQVREVDRAAGDALTNDDDKMSESWRGVEDVIDEVLDGLSRW